MTPSSRINATIELLEDILDGWQASSFPPPLRGGGQEGGEITMTPPHSSPPPYPSPLKEEGKKNSKRIPADKIIDRFFRARRYIGSKDRAYVGELVYWCLRHLALLEWIIGGEQERKNGRLIVLAALILRGEHRISELAKLCDGSDYAPHTITQSETKTLLAVPFSLDDAKIQNAPAHVRLNFPLWLEDELRKSVKGDFEIAMKALNSQAPTDLRVNTLKTTRDLLIAELNGEGFECDATQTSPIGIRLKKRAPIFTSPLFKAGHFEVQDEGSQMVAELVDAKAGMKVIDFCAGAGGKTLAIAAQMNNKGRILAWDTSEKRLKQIKERLARAGVDNVQIHVIESENDGFVKRHKDSADRVLVDAPCSGTGTWRRNPDLKWRFTQKDLDEVMEAQRKIIESAARLVKPGGRLIYATCSLLSCENDLHIDLFLKNNSHFKVVCAEKIWNKATSVSDEKKPSYLWVTPHQDGADGFFAAVLERIA